jgi:plastocyanin
MKTIQFYSVSLIAITILIVSAYQDAKALPGMTQQDLYKQSDMVFYGQVITKESGPGPDYYYYQVKVETYFKNPQASDSITIAGHKSSGGHVTYPQFEVGDSAIFYINKLDGVNTLSPYSQQSDSACSLSSFGLDTTFQSFGVIRGGFIHEIRILDSAGNAVNPVRINQPLLIQYDDFVNSLPEARTVTATLTIQKYNNTQPVFYQKQDIPMIACSFTPKPHWNFTPIVSGHYIAILTYDNQTITTDFDVRDKISSVVIDKPRLLLPLQQFKSGVATNDVICRSDLQLLIRNYTGLPVCVKQNSISHLLNRGWFYPSNCKYDSNPFTAGVEGLVSIEKNASNPSSGRSYSPINSTVVIGWNNTVSWINQDVTPSSITSDHGLFDSGPIIPGKDWHYSFECVGNYGYHSEPHPWMKGLVRVLPPDR